MQIFVSGSARKEFAPDQVVASATFSYHAGTYQEALDGGVRKVKDFINTIIDNTDFEANDFKTRTYSIREHFITNRIEAKSVDDLDKKLEKRVSDGFYFSQNISIVFDYDRERLAKLMAMSSRMPSAPMLYFHFELKDAEAKRRELISIAYADALSKAEALATAANKNLRDCVRVDIDGDAPSDAGLMMRGAAKFRQDGDFKETLQNIDETFKPENIELTKSISCVWETSN